MLVILGQIIIIILANPLNNSSALTPVWKSIVMVHTLLLIDQPAAADAGSRHLVEQLADKEGDWKEWTGLR